MGSFLHWKMPSGVTGDYALKKKEFRAKEREIFFGHFCSLRQIMRGNASLSFSFLALAYFCTFSSSSPPCVFAVWHERTGGAQKTFADFFPLLLQASPFPHFAFL